ncbi:hypothetical protein N8303_02490 [Gammaproteobacteria bacterium]|nr:hypothetical protein [Gammaproteobacteria bacterium]
MVKGGARKGSGRKSKPYRFLEVGGFCENLNHQLLSEKKRSRVKASLPAYDEAVSKAKSGGIRAYVDPKSDEQEDYHEKIEEELLKDRKKFKQSEALLDMHLDGKLDEEEYLQLRPSIPRYQRVKNPRPPRQEVLEKASKHFRLKVSTIDKYWKDFRKTLKDK